MDEQALQRLAQQLQDDLCPAYPGADVVEWLRGQVELLRAMNVPSEVATGMIDQSYIEWVQSYLPDDE